MKTSQLVYRARQFWLTINSRSSQIDIELISSILSPTQVALFRQMQASERVHSQRVLGKLTSQGERNHDLLVAALMHDVGKIRYPMNVFERVVIVLVIAVCPGCVRKLGHQPVKKGLGEMGWRRAFIVAVNHPRWGAELAKQCGTSKLAVELIARHEEHLDPSQVNGRSLEDRLLGKLQAADSSS